MKGYKLFLEFILLWYVFIIQEKVTKNIYFVPLIVEAHRRVMSEWYTI